ncbi:MAG: hypothetical protein WCP57_06150 [Bacteroidota bacterium]
MKKLILAFSILFVSVGVFAQTSSSTAVNTATNSPVISVDKTNPVAQPKLDNSGKTCTKSCSSTKPCCSSTSTTSTTGATGTSCTKSTGTTTSAATNTTTGTSTTISSSQADKRDKK